MQTIVTALNDFWTSLSSVPLSFKFPVDLIDILLVAYILYHGIRLVKETRAMQLVKGIAAMMAVYFVASILDMTTLGFFIEYIVQAGIFLVVVLFQPEIRSAFERMGRTRLGMWRFGVGQQEGVGESSAFDGLIDVIATSCAYLSARKIGALMVIERQTKLGDVISTGTIIDAVPSEELIENIFFTNSPLHDGAMVMRGNRLHAAGCYLPLSQNMEIARDLGTRHRAALGMSEVSDAVVVVVSEETGAITIANESRLQRGLSEQNLRKLLHIKLSGPDGVSGSDGKMLGFWRTRKK